MNPVDVRKILDKHDKNQGGLISILEDIQAKYSYLPLDALKIVAEETGHSLVDIYGVATFYKAFSLKPRGKHLVSACSGTACHVRGAPQIAKELERQLGIPPGETTPDKEFTLEIVNCLGACALGPIVVVDGHYFSKVTKLSVKHILSKAREGLDRVEVEKDRRVFPVEVSCARCNHSLMDPDYLIDGCPSIKVIISFENKHGWFLLSSLYGSYKVACEHNIPDNTIINFFCPHCNAELKSSTDCTECGAPMVPMIVKGGGMVQVCSRHGCKSHILDLDGVNF
ncbi:MAG: NAD(P)H-dependent oxidoreductase subunit E [Candidatus Krumholzibacteria bacterium]|nr:NAD(P)H-dependent oxidoreductase subunit E [Candidatus Krumholzibacteria bacterium]